VASKGVQIKQIKVARNAAYNLWKFHQHRARNFPRGD